MNFTKEEIVKIQEKKDRDCFERKFLCDNCVWVYGEDECVSKERCDGNLSEFKYVGDWELVKSKATTDCNGKPFEYTIFDIKKREKPLENVKEYIFKSPIFFQRYNDFSIESVKKYLAIRDKSLEILDDNEFDDSITVLGKNGISLYVYKFKKVWWNSGELPYKERCVNYLVHSHIRDLENQIKKYNLIEESVNEMSNRIDGNLRICQIKENIEYYKGQKEGIEAVLKIIERVRK